MTENWLVCGTRKKGYKYDDYRSLVFKELTLLLKANRISEPNFKPIIIEGCCPDSADQYAEQWAKENNIEVLHHPANTGNYLKRNIEMIHKANVLIAFWDQYSYGTAHSIAHATMKSIPTIIIKIK